MCKQYFYDFVNGFIVMTKIPIMWTVVKMCVIVFATVATTFIIATQFEQPTAIVIAINSWTVLYVGSLISAVILTIYLVKIGLIYYRTRQLKQTK